jgi:hypothetical protein
VGLERLIFRRPSLPSSVQTGADLAPVPDCGTMTDEHRWALGHECQTLARSAGSSSPSSRQKWRVYSRLMGTDEVSRNLLSMTTSAMQHAENHMLLLGVRPPWRGLPRSCLK